jgi:hypothetical protein
LITWRRPVAVRETRSAWKVASLPVEVRSTFSSEGTCGDELLRELDLDLVTPIAHQVDGAADRGDGRVDVGIVVPEERRAEGGVVVGEDAPVPS